MSAVTQNTTLGQWKTGVLAQQKAKCNATTMTPGHKNAVNQVLDELFDRYQCTLCHLPGHIAGYCPVNSMAWYHTKGNQATSDAWLTFRQTMKTDRKNARLLRACNQRQNNNKNSIQGEVAVKKARTGNGNGI